MARMQRPRASRVGIFAGVCLLLVVQASAYRMITFDERQLATPGLKALPTQLGSWKAGAEQSLETAVAEYLKPDDYILRDYTSADSRTPMNLFVAYFRSLDKTYGPHAPRICLPGSGWLERSAKIATIPVSGSARSFPVNQIIYEKAGTNILVLYWYQNSRSVWAEEFQAKLRLLPDLIRYRRSDVSLVRIIAPLRSTEPVNEISDGFLFAKLIFPSLTERLGTK